MGGMVGPDAGFALESDGLQAVTWDALDSIAGGVLTVSPADADGRGIALRVVRDGFAVDMTGAKVYLAWRHGQSLARGCVPFEAVDAANGEFRLFFPAAMAAAEGTAECQIIASWGKRALSSQLFTVRVARVMTGGADEECFNLLPEAIKRYEEACGLAVDAAEAARLAAEAVKQAAERGEFDGEDGAPGAPGAPGADGRDGASPSARVERVDGGAILTVEDADGITEAELMDGVSPQVFMDSQDGYLMLSIVDAEGGHSAMIPYGSKGDQGEPGEDGVGCTHSWDGTVLTVTSASGTSSADLVGPVGPAGPRVKQLWTYDKNHKFNWEVDTSWMDVPHGTLEVGDYVMARTTLGRVKSLSYDESAGEDHLGIAFVAELGSDQLGFCTGAELSLEEEKGSYEVRKPRVRQGDVVLSTDTGWLGTVGVYYTGTPTMTKCYLKGVCHLATRPYVDGELAKLAAPDLSGYATREWVQGLFDALPDLSGVEF